MNAPLMHPGSAVVQAATPTDLTMIYWLFEQAILYQKARGYIGWKTYDKEYLETDVIKGLLYKVTDGDLILCIFCVCYADPIIWREKERGDAVYLHRVVVHPQHRGGQLFGKVLDWALNHARELQRSFVRIDTWADNGKIIQYYTGYGFRFVEDYTTPDDPNLPDQHRNLRVALLEYCVNI
jgi:GNAT superfamily N-acetyltransferase